MEKKVTGFDMLRIFSAIAMEVYILEIEVFSELKTCFIIEIA